MKDEEAEGVDFLKFLPFLIMILLILYSVFILLDMLVISEYFSERQVKRILLFLCVAVVGLLFESLNKDKKINILTMKLKNLEDRINIKK